MNSKTSLLKMIRGLTRWICLSEWSNSPTPQKLSITSHHLSQTTRDLWHSCPILMSLSHPSTTTGRAMKASISKDPQWTCTLPETLKRLMERETNTLTMRTLTRRTQTQTLMMICELTTADCESENKQH